MTNRMTPETKVALDTYVRAILGLTHAATYPTEYATAVARQRIDDAIFLDGQIEGDLLEELLAAKRDVECEAAIDAICKRIQQIVATS